MRPILKPALARLWRDPATVQLGTDPERAVVLREGDAGQLALLDLIDGSRTEAALFDEAHRQGHAVTTVTDTLTALARIGALDDAAMPAASPRLEPDLLSLSLLHPAAGGAAKALRSRQNATIAVHGAGRVGSSVATLLGAAAVGGIHVVDDAALRDADLTPAGVRLVDRVGSNRAAATRTVVAGVAPALRSRPRRPDIVVLAPTGPVIPPEWAARAGDLPHLPVAIRETTAVIGPLVEPGRTPCLRCVELGRADRDAAWPALSAQLLGMSRRTEPCDVTLATLAATVAAMHVLTWIERPSALGSPGVVEFSLADLRMRRRSVAAHPDCGCGAA